MNQRTMQKVRYWKIRILIAVVMVSICGAASLVAQIVPTNGLIAYYPLNGNTDDLSGNGNNATSGSYNPTPDRCGNLDYACIFQGSPECVLLPYDSFISLNEYTYSLWFRADSLPTPAADRSVLFAVGSPSDGQEQAFSLKSDGTLAGSGSNTGTNPSLTTVRTAPVQTGRWIHGVLTRDNTNMRIFVDGTLMVNASGPDSLTNGQPANYGLENQTATIGGRWEKASPEFFVGAIDEVRIYNRALNEDEIKQLYYTECTLSEIFGPTEVCQGQQNVTFYVNPINNASYYDWSYSGLGVTIDANANNSTLDFSNNATSGTLSITVTGDFIDSQTRSLAINVNTLPSEAGRISGEPEVCQGEIGIIYQIPAIDNAKSYNWSYTGNGVALTGSTNMIVVDFTINATSGNLMVEGSNACGYGSSSPPFPVVVSQLPSGPGEITGEPVVCQSQQGISYAIPAIQNATGYIWNYSGTGAVITGNSNAVTVDFDNTATSGDLTVTGTNRCGNSATSALLAVTVLSVPAGAGTISGENEVCLNQTQVPYSVSAIPYATNYLWEYSGTGIALTGNTNAITMDFSGQSTGGNLSVVGQNICGKGGKSPELSITVSDCSVNPVEISIPNSFSPNSDGVNEVFQIRGLPENSTLIIFDRAGHTLFESASYTNNWDGKDKAGNVLASGTYWYVLAVPGKPEEYKGFVYLKR